MDTLQIEQQAQQLSVADKMRSYVARGALVVGLALGVGIATESLTEESAFAANECAPGEVPDDSYLVSDANGVFHHIFVCYDDPVPVVTEAPRPPEPVVTQAPKPPAPVATQAPKPPAPIVATPAPTMAPVITVESTTTLAATTTTEQSTTTLAATTTTTEQPTTTTEQPTATTLEVATTTLAPTTTEAAPTTTEKSEVVIEANDSEAGTSNNTARNLVLGIVAIGSVMGGTIFLATRLNKKTPQNA